MNKNFTYTKSAPQVSKAPLTKAAKPFFEVGWRKGPAVITVGPISAN